MKTFKFEDFNKMKAFGFTLLADGQADEALAVDVDIQSEAEFEGFRKGMAVRDVNLNLNLNLDLNLNLNLDLDLNLNLNLYLNLYLRSFTTVWMSPNRSRSSQGAISSSWMSIL